MGRRWIEVSHCVLQLTLNPYWSMFFITFTQIYFDQQNKTITPKVTIFIHGVVWYTATSFLTFSSGPHLKSTSNTGAHNSLLLGQNYHYYFVKNDRSYWHLLGYVNFIDFLCDNSKSWLTLNHHFQKGPMAYICYLILW